jgi:predicted TIM-barrel fold metal-dependent hydrolase
MAAAAIIDALFCIPKSTRVLQISDCIPFDKDLGPEMKSSGITGTVLAPCNCAQCQHQWNCADRRTQEIVAAVKQNPKRLSGLASYDPLRVGDSLRWIDEAIGEGELAGAYAQAECCVSGLDAPRMYPLYGICAKLRAPVVLDFTSHERWTHHRPQVEVVAADFPELDIVLATPRNTDAGSMIRLMQRFPHIAFVLSPQDLQADALLCEYVELQGRERVAFRAEPQKWPAAVQTAMALPLGPAAKRAYLSENAARLFRFPVEVPA